MANQEYLLNLFEKPPPSPPKESEASTSGKRGRKRSDPTAPTGPPVEVVYDIMEADSDSDASVML